MEVILKQDIEKLGHAGEVVKVADGYGRNYLLPRKLAIEATKANKSVIEQMKTAATKRAATDKQKAQELAAQLEGITVVITRRAGEKDQLFGSVTSSDIAEALAAKGQEIDRRKIQLDEPLKALGEFTVPVKIYRDVVARVSVHIRKEGGDAAPVASNEAAPAETAEAQAE